MKSLGQRIIAALTDFRDGLSDGKHYKQTVVRRINVKGKTVYVDETFTGPVRSFPKRKKK